MNKLLVSVENQHVTLNNYFVAQCAVSNSNCPAELLKIIIEKGNDHELSQSAALNPNCPPELFKIFR